ncbi:uncharacterized protein LOC129302682 [Prosopis cineraria]|uniref:uncharacterized protein LOC129302682 n=1 Tax=Prosopis cineraria TaxID=364024 RepID=UPI00240F8B89|nr:uncharacterized protein LOC129302682 [Prosopis cineraria]
MTDRQFPKIKQALPAEQGNRTVENKMNSDEQHREGGENYLENSRGWQVALLRETNPTTVAKWDASDSNRFEKLFIAYGYCILNFLEGCRHILYIDGWFLSGPYKETLLATSAYNVNNDLFPLAYAIVSRETFEDWSWFLENIKGIIRSVEITLIFDSHNAIVGAMQVIFGGERHAYYYYYVKKNFNVEYVKTNKGQRRMLGNGKEATLKLLDVVAYARHKEEFNIAMGNLRLFSPQLAQWVEAQGNVDRWVQCKFSYKQWDDITTNLTESFNAWIVKE